MNEIALIGKKIGMTREFYKTGQLVPVTVLKMEKARVIHIIEKEKRVYKAVQLGYCKIKNSSSGYNNKIIFTAFQRKYRQDLINGKIDKECLLISKNLAKKLC